MVGRVTLDQIRDIAILKKQDLNTDNIEKAMSIIQGTARSMGIQVEK